MYHSPPRNVLVRRKLLAWFVSWVAVIIGVTIVSALTLGYGFNKNDGRIEQGGIIQLDSTPRNATVTINRLPYSSTTPTKLVSSIGEYAIRMDKPLYRTWQKTVPIQAGNITWVAYPRLFPQQITPSTVASFDSLAGALPSGNSKRYAFLEHGDQPVIAIAPLDSDTVKLTRITIPDEVITKSDEDKPSSFTLYLWSGNQKFLIVKHMYVVGDEQKLEWLLVNVAEPDKTINVNSTYGINPSEVVFGNNDGGDLVTQIDGDIRRVDLGSQTLSRPLAHNVESFRLYNEEYIIYISKPLPDNTQQIGYVRSGFSTPFLLTTVPYDGATSAFADFGKYFDDTYLLVSHGRVATFYTMRGFHGSEKDTVTLKKVTTLQTQNPIIDLDITSNGQFATAQDGRSLAVYDLEVRKKHMTSLMVSGDDSQKLRHLDNYLYWGYNDGVMRTYEFDGANQYNLMPLEPQFDATFSPSGKYLYSVALTDSQYSLQRIQMF